MYDHDKDGLYDDEDDREIKKTMRKTVRRMRMKRVMMWMMTDEEKDNE